MSTYQDPQISIDAGGQALRSNRFPWYDAAKDGLKRVEVRPPHPASVFDHSQVLSFLINAAALILLALVLAALVLMILRAMGLRKAAARDRAQSPIGEAQRIEALPYPIPRANLSLLDQARNFYRAGDYARAVLYLFSHQLLQLDRRQIIRVAKGKTNRQYLREVGKAEALRQLLGQTLVAFEDVFFGQHEIDRKRFEACWSRLSEFELLLAKGPPPGA